MSFGMMMPKVIYLALLRKAVKYFENNVLLFRDATDLSLFFELVFEISEICFSSPDSTNNTSEMRFPS